jgi:hypothetical protein
MSAMRLRGHLGASGPRPLQSDGTGYARAKRLMSALGRKLTLDFSNGVELIAGRVPFGCEESSSVFRLGLSNGRLGSMNKYV